MSETLLQREIRQQPEVLQNLLTQENAAVTAVAAAIRERKPRLVMFAARGSSDNAARYGQYLFGSQNRLPVALATPSLFTLYETPPDLRDALVIGISQSGQSPDIVAVMQEGNRQGAISLALTNTPDSPLAEQAQYTLSLRAGREESVAATKTYTASLLLLAMLGMALNEDAVGAQALQQVPGMFTQTLAKCQPVMECSRSYQDAQAFVVLGRGYNYATAYEIALKLKELAYILAEPYSSADFRHGSVSIVQRGFPVIAVVAEGRVAAETLQLLRELRERGARIIVISALDEAAEIADTVLSIPAGIPEHISPLVSVLPGQMLALGLTLAKGLNPDRPRGLHKVTLSY